MNMKNILSFVLLVALMTGISLDADAQKRKKKKKKKGKVEQVLKTPANTRIIESDTSKVCKVFTIPNPNKAEISQEFADMNLRRQAGDFSTDEYSAYYYWKRIYEKAPGFSILIYTDGSAIFRELASQAKEAGDEAKFKEYSQKALDLLDEGEKCYPETKGKFGPAKAYIYELLHPGKYNEILALYTQNLGPDTDPYSLGSIARYAKYMGYIEQLPKEEANALVTKVKAIATAKKGQKDYDYAMEQIEGIEEQYNELEKEREAQLAAAAQQQEQAAAASAASANASVYNDMIAAIESGDLTTAHNKFKEYVSKEDDATRKYQTAMYVGGSHYQANDFPKAREAYQVAAEADATQGEPYYYIGLMYLSSGPLCGPGTGFDSQRVIWVAFDKFDMAMTKTLSEDIKADIASTKSEYASFIPTKEQITKKQLNVGDAYTVPCWINETTTIRPSN